jgi:hypothetical protein
VVLAKLNSFATRDQRAKRHKVEIAISTAILLYICVRTCQCLLVTAIRVGALEEVRFLLARGADPEIRNRIGHTALEEAHKTAYTHLVDLLKSV